MSPSAFQITVPGKWVLAGEHAVLRGATAVALPHREARLKLSFEPGSGPLQIEPRGADPVVRDVMRAFSDLAGSGFEMPRGTLNIESTIPSGGGLGSSAALCVAITRWLAPIAGIAPERFAEIATALEHRFHGKSSGMDVATVLAGEPIAFTIEGGAHPLGIKKLPRFTLHDTGLRARTRECIEKVAELRSLDPRRAAAIDDRMALAARESIVALKAYDRGTPGALFQLSQAMDQAAACFDQWGLVPPQASRLMKDLRQKGALSAKPTGAGGGGFVVALWPEDL